MNGKNNTRIIPDTLCPEQGARLGWLEVSPNFLLALCRDAEHHFSISEHAVPIDAEIIKIGVCNGNLRLLLKSKSFKPLNYRDFIPVLTPPTMRGRL